MFSDANTTHFTLFVEGLAKDQNANKPIDELNAKSNVLKPTGITNNTNAGSSGVEAGHGLTDTLADLTSSVTSNLSGFGDKFSGLGSSLKSLDPFTTLQQANELKAALGAAKSNSTDEEKEKPKTAVDRLQILSLNGYEGVSTPYALEVVLVNEFVRFDVTSLLSKPVFIAFTPTEKMAMASTV